MTGAIFPREYVAEIPIILETDVPEAIKIMNCSCLSGGQYLSSSDGSLVIVAAFAATRNLKNELASYATGEIPAELAYDEIKNLIEQTTIDEFNESRGVLIFFSPSDAEGNPESLGRFG